MSLGWRDPLPGSATERDPPSLDFFESRILTCSDTLRRLRQAKHTYGHDPLIAARFDKRRRSFFHDDNQSYSRDQFASILAQVDEQVGGLFSGGRVRAFLDLGCAPGGFSHFLLENNPGARGLGVTLPSIPLASHGTPLADPNRYRVQHRDITLTNFDPMIFPAPAQRLGLERAGYDLIIAGAFPTGQRISAIARARLAFTQLHAILCNLQEAATCVIVANTKPFLWIAEMFGVLRRVFGRIQPAKHKAIHADRSSCYFVCTGFNKGHADLWKSKVKRALNTLRASEEDEAVTSPRRPYSPQPKQPESKAALAELQIFDSDFDLEAFFDGEHRSFLDTMEPLWTKQIETIEARMSQAQGRAQARPDNRLC
jgi:23S rRNA U2552 (ribose-2'-O)-methylase RlmE/FtsJ